MASPLEKASEDFPAWPAVAILMFGSIVMLVAVFLAGYVIGSSDGRCKQACLPERHVGTVGVECICEAKRVRMGTVK